MSNPRILVVEDEGIIAKDIQNTLNRSGYSVIAVVSSGEEAIEKAMEAHPDLVLMDIVLEGNMDGVKAAEHIRDRFNIPVVYLTAYSDDKTLQRAKITEPFGYILKPFQERELYTTIEMALYKHNMEKKLKESKQCLDTTLKSIGDAVIAADTGKLITFMNPIAEALTGWSQEEAIGKPLKDVFKIINEETGKQAEDPAARVLREGVIVGLANHTVLIAKDGTKRSVDDSGAPIRDDKGKISGAVLVFRDITERKHLEKQLFQALKMESIGTLAGGIAHDFNNLLMGILGNTSLMLLNADPSDSNYKRLKNIEKQVESGSRLTAQLLGYARKGKYELKPINLNQLMKDTSELFGRTRKDISIYLELSPDLLPIEADKGQIEQVLWNLYVNAADAMPGGGDFILKTVNADCKNRKGRLSVLKPGKYVVLALTDTGIGMDKKTQERIFDPFFTTKEMGRGTGLGLASVYGIINRHDGYIDVESRKGKGSTFSIYLPASAKKIAKPANITEKLLKGTETVLLVDDEELILNVARDLLEAIGCKVLTARDGREAIKLYQKNQNDIDIVILDMIMPNMSGGDVYDRMKEINQDIKALLSSGYSIDELATDILNRGCNGFIQKPFTINELSAAIRQILDKKLTHLKVKG